MNALNALAAPVGRVLLAMIFVISGLDKIGNYAATLGYMESAGVPGTLLPLVILVEVGAGLAVIVGWQTRLAALTLAGFSIIAALLFHADFGNQVQTIMFMKNLAIAGGLFMLVTQGAGSFALDNRLVNRVPG